MSSNPLLTIGLPVYNGERFLAKALDSYRSQSFTDFQILLSDNASTDRTEEISSRLRRKRPAHSVLSKPAEHGRRTEFSSRLSTRNW